MDFIHLQQALSIRDGKTILPKGPIADFDEVLDTCYGGQPLVLDAAEPGLGDGLNDTVVRTGTAAFLTHPALPVVATFRLVSRRVQAIVRYALPVGGDHPRGWRFSDSFPHLPAVADWRSGDAPVSVPLNDITFERAAFIVASHEDVDGATEAKLQPGLNFVGRMRLSDQAPTGGVTAAIKRVFGYNDAELWLVGAINLKGTGKTPPPRIEDIWAVDGARLAVPGILLSAPLGRDKRLGTAPSDPALEGVSFRIYSPLSGAVNANYAPIFGYTGTLRLPNAGPQVTATASALQALGGDELLLAGRFKDVSVGSLARLADVGGGQDLRRSMDGTLQAAAEKLSKLELMSAHLAMSVTAEGAVDVSAASVTFGLPLLDWTVFEDVLEINSLTASVEVRDPFRTRAPDPMDRFRFGADRVSATLSGTALAFGKPFEFTASTKTPYRVSARLAPEHALALSDLRRKYPGSVPPLKSDPEVDYLAVTAQHASGARGSSGAFAGRLRCDPPWDIAGGLKLSKVSLYLTAAREQVNGELSAVVELAGVEVGLKTRKAGSDWLFEGRARPGQTIDFLDLAEKTAGGRRLATPKGYGDFPESLTIKEATASLTLPEGAFGDVHVRGLATFEAWRFSLGPVAFEVTGLGGELFLSNESARSRARLFGSIRIGDGLDAAASVQLGGAEVDTVVNIALMASDDKPPGVVSVVERVAGSGRFTAILPASLSDRLPTFSEFRAAINLTQGIYIVEGALKGVGQAYLVYRGLTEPQPGSEYVFAAELGADFKFRNLLSDLSPVDDLVSVEAAKLAVYSVRATDRAQSLTNLQRLVQGFVKDQAAPWSLPSTGDPVLASDTGLVVTTTLALRRALWGVAYAFKGAFKLTSDRMQGKLQVWATDDNAKTLRNPFQLPGIEITDLSLQLEARLGAGAAAPTLVLLGRTRLGPRGESLDLVATLAFAGGKPTLMSITLDRDLKVRQFIAQCFAETARDTWPDSFVELTFKKESRIYYYDAAAAADPLLKPGFNVDALADLALGDTTVGLRFTLRTMLNAQHQPVGFTATGGLDSAVKLWRLELASDETGRDQSGARVYIRSPTLSVEAPSQGPWKFGLSVGVNLFDRAIGHANATLSRTETGATRLEGKIAAGEPAPVFGPLAVSFAYTREPDGGHALRIGDLPDLETVGQVFDLLEKIADLVKTAEHGGCGDLARYLARRTLATTYTASPSIGFSGTDATVSVTLGCSTRFGDAHGPVAIEWIPVTIDFPLPKSATLDSLGDAILRGVTGGIEQVVRQLLQQPDKIAQFFALAFAEEGVAYALDLLCRRFFDPKFPGRPPVPIIPPAVPTLTGFAWAALEAFLVGFVGTLGALAAWLLGQLSKTVKTESEKQPPPKPADPDKLEAPTVTGLALKGDNAIASWRAVPFAGGYEYELTAPAPLGKLTGPTPALSKPITIKGRPAGPYGVRVRAVRERKVDSRMEMLTGAWSPPLGKFLAPTVQLVTARRGDVDYLEATWPPLADGPWTYDHELCLGGEPLQPQPALVSPHGWALTDLAAGGYTARVIVRGSDPNYAASDWSEPSTVVTKLAPPRPQTLTFSDDGGQDQVRLAWLWPGPETGVAFDARLVAEGLTAVAARQTPTTAGTSFDSTSLPVATYRAETRTYPRPASTILAGSDWSAPSACAIAKLPPPKIRSVTHRAGAELWTELALVGAVEGADVYYVRLVHPGGPSERVEFQVPGPGRIRIPDDYVGGTAQLGVRAARRDGAAIASDWAMQDVLRLAPPTGASTIYDRRAKEIRVRFEAAPQAGAILATLRYEIQVLVGTPLELFGDPITVPSGVETSFKVVDFPAGPVHVQVRTVAPQDADLLRSPWRPAQPALRKLAAAVVTDVSYNPELQGVRVKLADAGPGLLYEVRFDADLNAQGTASEPDISCPNPFAAGAIGTRTVSARLASADPQVIDGEWTPAGRAFELTKYPQPTDPRLGWDQRTGQLTVSLSPTAGTERHEAQLLADGRPFGAVLDLGPNASARSLPLADELPAGAIAAQARSSGPAPRTIPGDWIASNALDRPGPVAAQPQLRYTPGEEVIVADWTLGMPGEAPSPPQRLAVQVLSGPTGPVGPVATLDAAAYPRQLSFPIAGLEPGEVRVRFRAAPEGASVLPGVWTPSQRTLTRLSPASPHAEHSYVDGTLTVTLSGLDPKGARPDAFELSFADAEAKWRPRYPLRISPPPGEARAVLRVPPENFPVGEHEVRVRAIGDGAQTIDGATTSLQYRLAAIGRPTLAPPAYAWGKLKLAWSNANWVILPFAVTGDAPQNRVRIRTGGGPVSEVVVFRDVPRLPGQPAPQSLELNIDQLEDLPRGVVWDVSVQAIGPYSINHGGSGPWSEPRSVLILDAPTGLGLTLRDGRLNGRWTPPPCTVPLTYELEFVAANDPTPRSFGGIKTPSVDYDFDLRVFNTQPPLEGPFTMRVRASVDGVYSAWTASVVVAAPTNAPNDLTAQIATKSLGSPSCPLAVRWAPPPGANAQSYDLELHALARWNKPPYYDGSDPQSQAHFLAGPLPSGVRDPIPRRETGLLTPSFREDLWTYADGLYTVRVRALVEGRPTSWTEPVSFVIAPPRSQFDYDTFVERLIRASGMPAAQAAQNLRQIVRSISPEQLREKLTRLGYSHADVEGAVPRAQITYRKTETSQKQIVDSFHPELPTVPFDDALKTLSPALTEINVWLEPDQMPGAGRRPSVSICGLQCVFTDFEGRRLQGEMHGREGINREIVYIPHGSRITKISGDARNRFYGGEIRPVRVSALAFFLDGSEAPFKAIGHAQREMPFSFEAAPGEEVFCFFGATYVDDELMRQPPYLAWLGVWMKHTG